MEVKKCSQEKTKVVFEDRGKKVFDEIERLIKGDVVARFVREDDMSLRIHLVGGEVFLLTMKAV